MSETIKLKRRDLSGIYIFDKFPNEERRKPTCVEDCQQETRRKWCMSKDKDYLRETIKMLAYSFNELCDYLKEEDCMPDEQHQRLALMINDQIKLSENDWPLDELAQQVDTICRQLVMLADYCGVTKHIDEEP